MDELLKIVFVRAGVGLWALAAGCSTERGAANAPTADRCQGVGPTEPHQILLDSRNIESIATLKEEPFVTRPSPLKTDAAESRGKVIGVRIVWRPVLGITAERLSLLAHCDRHGNRPSLLTAHEPTCPFAVNGTSTTVTSTGMGFAADVIASDAEALPEIIQRASALAKASSGTPLESP